MGVEVTAWDPAAPHTPPIFPSTLSFQCDFYCHAPRKPPAASIFQERRKGKEKRAKGKGHMLNEPVPFSLGDNHFPGNLTHRFSLLSQLLEHCPRAALGKEEPG